LCRIELDFQPKITSTGFRDQNRNRDFCFRLATAIRAYRTIHAGTLPRALENLVEWGQFLPPFGITGFNPIACNMNASESSVGSSA
jgi:hypothetical protein